MAKLERIYTIPLRREFNKVPGYRRTRKSVIAVREFLQKHMKCDDVRIGKHLNLELWKHGRKNPPPRIKIKAIKDTEKIKEKEFEIVRAELLNIPIEKPSKKQEQKKKLEQKIEAISEGEQKQELEKERREVLEQGIKKEERKTLQESQAKPEDVMKHRKVSTKQIQKKLREQHMVTEPQKPSHETHERG